MWLNLWAIRVEIVNSTDKRGIKQQPKIATMIQPWKHTMILKKVIMCIIVYSINICIIAIIRITHVLYIYVHYSNNFGFNSSKYL